MPIRRASGDLQSILENYLRSVSQSESLFSQAITAARSARLQSLANARRYSETLLVRPHDEIAVMDSNTAQYLHDAESLERESEMIASMVILAIDEDMRRLCRLTTNLKPFEFQYGEEWAGSTTAELVWAAANSCRHAFEWEIAIARGDTTVLGDKRFQRNQEILSRLLNTQTVIVTPCCYEALTAMASDNANHDVCDIEIRD